MADLRGEDQNGLLSIIFRNFHSMLCGYNFAGKELVFNYLDVFFQANVSREILQKYLKYSDLSPFSIHNNRTSDSKSQDLHLN